MGALIVLTSFLLWCALTIRSLERMGQDEGNNTAAQAPLQGTVEAVDYVIAQGLDNEQAAYEGQDESAAEVLEDEEVFLDEMEEVYDETNY